MQSVAGVVLLLLVPLVLLIWAFAAANAQRDRTKVLASTLGGALIMGILPAGGYATWWIPRLEGSELIGLFAFLLTVPIAVWGAAVGSWIGFGIARRAHPPWK